MRAAVGVLVSLLVAGTALAHIVPLNPSTCALDVSLELPDAGLAATVDPPAADDRARFTYEPDSSPAWSRVQACPFDPAAPGGCATTSVPRAFAIGDTTGTLSLPPVFTLWMLSSGDLRADAVPITITVDGAPVVVPFAMTTGFTSGAGGVLLGAPLDAAGAMRVVGRGDGGALPPPLGDAPLVLTLACTHAPAPDRDQFALAPRLTRVRGVATSSRTTLVMLLESEPDRPFDPTGMPTILRVASADGPLVDRVMTLVPGPRGRFVSDDGALTVSPLRRRGLRAHRVVFRDPSGPSALASGEGVVAIETGGLMARRAVTLGANRSGSRLAVRER